MIYLFTGNSDYLVNQQVQKWKQAFKEKHGEENITHLNQLDGNTKNIIGDTLVSRSLFVEKRLVLISGFPYSGDNAFSGASELEEQLLELLPDIPDEVLVVFSSINPDKRKKGWKQLQKLSEVKEFNIAGEQQISQILTQKYRGIIEPTALARIIFLKGSNLQKCISEIEKLIISPLSEISNVERGDYKIVSRDIDDYIAAEFEESIFVFIDTLMGRDGQKIFSELSNLIESSNLYAIYQSIIANLRIFLYIELLKSQKKSIKEITDILRLGNRSFLIQKNHACTIKSLSKLQEGLLNFDKNMKFGKFTSSDPADLKRELENVLLKFLT